MSKTDFFKLSPRINGLFPFYEEDGTNATRIELCDGNTVIDRRTINTVLKSLAGAFCVDLKEVRKTYGQHVKRKITPPLPIRTLFLLMPVRYRVPIAREDGAYAFIAYHKVKGGKPSKENDRFTTVEFNNEKTFTARQRCKTFEEMMDHSEKAARLHWQLHGCCLDNNLFTYDEMLIRFSNKMDHTKGNYT